MCFKVNNGRISDKYYNRTCWLKYRLKVHFFNKNNMAALLKKSHLMVVLIVIRRKCLDAAKDADVSQGPH